MNVRRTRNSERGPRTAKARMMTSISVEGSETNPHLVSRSVQDPRPGPRELLIRVHAAGVIPTELGWYPTWHQKSGEPRRSAVPGHEFSGTIAAIGNDAGSLAVGDEA